MLQFSRLLGIVCLSIPLTLSHPLFDTDSNPNNSPLYLTPYIERGDIIRAKAAAKVPSLIEGEDVISYSGYLTVNSTYNSNLFFWFFPAENAPEKSPVVLWLQGGPGASSLQYGLFAENGPFFIVDGLTLKRRATYWSQEFNMIYMDNPVGTGFSFTDNDAGYVTDETQVGNQLYSAMYQFFQLFPEHRDTGFFITGESYAGKYIPALGYAIHTKNPTAIFPIDLQGVAIGDGWVDPIHMEGYSDYLFQIGLIDDNDRDQMKIYELECVQLLQEGKYYDALLPCGNILGVYYNVSGVVNVYNYAQVSGEDDVLYVEKFLALPKVRKSLHVGNQTFNDGAKAGAALLNDTVKSVAPWLEILMNNYRVLLYNGQLDIIVAYPLTMNMVSHLNWNGATAYATAERKLWKVNNEPAGFFRTGGNFTEVLVRNAGHLVPSDQPVWALDLITRFVHNVALDYEFS